MRSTGRSNKIAYSLAGNDRSPKEKSPGSSLSFRYFLAQKSYMLAEFPVATGATVPSAFICYHTEEAKWKRIILPWEEKTAEIGEEPK